MQRPGKPEARGRPTPCCGRTDLDESATPAPVRQFDDKQPIAADGTGHRPAVDSDLDRRRVPVAWGPWQLDLEEAAWSRHDVGGDILAGLRK